MTLRRAGKNKGGQINTPAQSLDHLQSTSKFANQVLESTNNLTKNNVENEKENNQNPAPKTKPTFKKVDVINFDFWKPIEGEVKTIRFAGFLGTKADRFDPNGEINEGMIYHEIEHYKEYERSKFLFEELTEDCQRTGKYLACEKYYSLEKYFSQQLSEEKGFNKHAFQITVLPRKKDAGSSEHGLAMFDLAKTEEPIF